METRPRTTPFRSKTGLLAALAALLSAGFSKESEEFQQTRKNGHRHGKHNGAQPGAFGGPKSAKAHRRVYVDQLAG